MTPKQPDLHHEGPLTVEFVEGLSHRLAQAIADMKAFVPPDADPGWEICKRNWLNSFEYAGLRCAAILTKLEFGFQEHRQEEDHKCIDITLCILRDFDEAKALNFQRILTGQD
jgi:hypothetical protein